MCKSVEKRYPQEEGKQDDGSSGSNRVRSSETPMGETSKAVRVWLLGGFRVSVGSRTIPQDSWRLRKAATLVKLLTLAPGHRLHREQVMDILWPDSGRRAASNNLRQALHTARNVLDPAMGARYLASEGESLVLCPKDDLWVDVDAFEAAAAAARRAMEVATYRAVLDLYRSDLLPEDPTKSGRKVGATSCGNFILPCSSSSQGFMKNAMSTIWPSRYYARRRLRSPP